MSDLSYKTGDESWTNNFDRKTDGTSSYTDLSYETGDSSTLTDMSYRTGDSSWSNNFDLDPTEVVSIEITTAPTTVDYYEGDTLDLTGMVITATYDDGTTAVVTDYTASPADGDTLADETEVTITCGEATATQAITVTALAVESIAVTTAPDNVSYSAGDTLDLTGMVITATYNSGATEVVTDYTASPADGDTLTDETEVTITYEEKTTTQAITVA